MNTESVCFTEEDLQLFCASSGDRNPLHLMEAYASKTSYGQRVVFGALGAIACFGFIKIPATQSVVRVTADFHRPMFLGVAYQVDSITSESSQTIRLFDGSVLMLTLSVLLGKRFADEAIPQTTSPLFERKEASKLSLQDIELGQEFKGTYAAAYSKLAALCQRWGVEFNTLITELLLWSSYFIGMELPGQNALFFRLAFEAMAASLPGSPIEYVGTVSNLNKAVEQIKIHVTLSAHGKQLATGQLTAFVRPELSPVNLPLSTWQDHDPKPFEGKVALVLGASRGLGAALTMLLASAGAEVIALSRSSVENHTFPLPPSLQQRISYEVGDCANNELMASLHNNLTTKFGKLDILVCNAFPPIPALRLEPNALNRIEEYISQSINLVLTPLCTFLPLVHESRGCVTTISSSAVEKPVREWPHYVAAKSAIESLAHVASLQYLNVSSLIVRPPRLLTDMTNTPLGRQGATSPMVFAQQIIKKLETPLVAGRTEVFNGDLTGSSNT